MEGYKPKDERSIGAAKYLKAAAARVAEARLILKRSGIEGAPQIADALGPYIPEIGSLHPNRGGAQ
jgi:hypothetical protein